MNDRRQYELHFEEVLERLNPAQREAVEQTEGPVMVIAGPGTGKTQILAARIGKILSSSDLQAAPSNILCLTYTDAGTVAMRKRLVDFIGPEAYKVNIHTFHSFCNRVISENPEAFGIGAMQPVSDIELIDIFRELIDGFPSDHPLKRFTGDIYYDITRLKNLFSFLKTENRTPEEMSSEIDSYLVDLPIREEYYYKRSGKGYQKGDFKQKEFDAEKAAMERLRAAVFEFYKFDRIMKERRRYDYDDMILWVTNKFRLDDEVLLRYKEQFLYVLADEYQDTNGTQSEILRLLTEYERPNVFVVGDDDQSIFRFQGANLANIVDFYERHREDGLKIVILTENYRSRQAILDVSRSLIELNEERLTRVLPGAEKILREHGSNFLSDKADIRVIEYPNVIQEEAGIIAEIENIYKRGGNLEETAVIYRSHRTVENIVKVLEQRKIPLNIRRRVNILQLPFTKKILNVLRYLDEEYEKPDSAEHLLFELMHYDFFNIDARDAAITARFVHIERRDKNIFSSWRTLLSDGKKLQLLQLRNPQALSLFELRLCSWLAYIPNMTLQVLFEKIITEGEILSYVFTSPERNFLLQVLNTLFDFIKETAERHRNLTLKEFLQIIHRMEHHALPLSLVRSMTAANGVHFVTAHSSKGLEFRNTFLIGCTSSNWESKMAPPSEFKLPDTIFQDHQENSPEEERRLFYVALTRAKENLYISYASKNSNDKEQEKSRFVAEICEYSGLKIEYNTVGEEVVFTTSVEVLQGASEGYRASLFDPLLIAEALRDFRMNITHLNKYLACPLCFYFEDIVKVPTAKSESLGFGSAVHTALELLFKNITQANEGLMLPNLEHFTDYFMRGMRRCEEWFTKESFRRRSEYGKRILADYYRRYASSWKKVVVTEYYISQVEMDGVPLNGKIDKLEFDRHSVNVVDYKTGKPEYAGRKLLPPDSKEPKGGDYWRQMVFYKILMDGDTRKPWDMISGEVDFIEKNKNGDFEKHQFFVTAQDIEVVKKQIKEVYESIMRGEFAKGCGKKECKWCGFVREYYSKNEEVVFAES